MPKNVFFLIFCVNQSSIKGSGSATKRPLPVALAQSWESAPRTRPLISDLSLLFHAVSTYILQLKRNLRTKGYPLLL